jgi:hypothetical protein
MIETRLGMSRDVGLHPAPCNAFRRILLHRCDREVPHHTRDMNQPPVRIAETRTVGVAQFEDTPRATEWFVLTLVADHVKHA